MSLPAWATQTRLRFDPEPSPALRLNPTAPNGRKPGLQRACWKILDLLEAGPTSMVEMMQATNSPCYGRRVDELRRFLRALCGFDPRDRTKNPIICDRADSANPQYRLAVWAQRRNRPSHVVSSSVGT